MWGRGTAWGSGSLGEQHLGRPEVPEVPEGTLFPPLPSPCKKGILKNDLSLVGVGTGQSPTLLPAEFYGKP